MSFSIEYGCPCLFVGLYFTFSQIYGFTPRIKISHSDLSMDRSIRIVRQLKQVFEPYCTLFKEVQGKKGSNSPSHSIWKEKKNTKNTGTFLRGQSVHGF
jgi:hypothetical protein